MFCSCNINGIATFAIAVSVLISFAPFFRQSTKINYSLALFFSFCAVIFAIKYHYNILPSLCLLLALIPFGIDKEKQSDFDHIEYILLFFFILAGVYQIIYAKNLISFYVGLEMQSIPMYIIIALVNNRQDKVSDTMKYFVLSSTFSAITLLGISYVYGAFGSITFAEIPHLAFSSHKYSLGLAILGVFFIFFGALFKLAMPPFHLWVSDLYSALNYRTIAIFSVVPKFSFLIFLSNILVLFENSKYSLILHSILFTAGLFGAIIGSIGLLLQNNIKRFIAYSGIAQLSYPVLTIAAAGNIIIFGQILNAKTIATLYMLSYFVSLLPLTIVVSNYKSNSLIGVLNGIYSGDKKIAYCLIFSFLSFAGMPIFAGFVGKSAIIAHLIGTSNIWISVMIIVPTVIAGYAYFNIIKNIYFEQYEKTEITLSFSEKAIIYMLTIFNILTIFCVKYILQILET